LLTLPGLSDTWPTSVTLLTKKLINTQNHSKL
jgi:hypothetical protein